MKYIWCLPITERLPFQAVTQKVYFKTLLGEMNTSHRNLQDGNNRKLLMSMLKI